MHPLSVVIVCKNEADTIANSLQSLEGITDDIIVYDNGSTDGTQQTVRQFNVQLREGSWEGFGKTKTKAISLARHDWILSLDADESIDEELKQSLLEWQPGDTKTVYNFAFKNYLGNRHLKYGEWGRDYHTRLFNRKEVSWNDAPVHENLVLPADAVVRNMKGHILHRTMKDIQDYSNKMVHYAMLSAERYYQQGKKASWVKLRISPGFSFFHYYLLKLGFLDGHAGYVSARMTAWYTFMKYARLKEMWKNNTPNK